MTGRKKYYPYLQLSDTLSLRVLLGVFVFSSVGNAYATELKTDGNSVASNESSTLLLQEDGPGKKKIPAFPGAMGFGAKTTGGRGGEVRIITSLDDEGEGSFRAAVAGDEPKIVVFSVGGSIRLKSNVMVGRNTTIAGQTAPGGIAFYNIDPAKLDPDAAAGRIELQDNTILRHVKIRGSSFGGEALMSLGETRHVIIDHVSIAWAGDESIALSDGLSEATIQWSTFESPLGLWHKKAWHNYGAKLTGPNNGNLSFYYNLHAHARARAPSISSLSGATIDVRGNLIYNSASGIKIEHAYKDEDYEKYALDDEAEPVTRYNLIGNMHITGPQTKIGSEGTPTQLNLQRPIELYVTQHRDDAFPDTHDRDLLQLNKNSQKLLTFASAPFDVPDNPPSSGLLAETAAKEVMGRAGAFPRDHLTKQTMEDIQTKGGVWSSALEPVDEEMIQAYELLAASIPDVEDFVASALDTDKDGMPDDWELDHQLDAGINDSAATTLDPNGYSNIEIYVNELADTLVSEL